MSNREQRKPSEWLNILYFIFWPTMLLGLGWIAKSISELQLQTARIEVVIRDFGAQEKKLDSLNITVQSLTNRITILETKVTK